MKFYLRIIVTSALKGVPLLKEYRRLGFDEKFQKDNFPVHSFTIEIPDDLAIKHEKYFQFSTVFNARIDSSYTTAENWKSLWPHGMQLQPLNISRSDIESALALTRGKLMATKGQLTHIGKPENYLESLNE